MKVNATSWVHSDRAETNTRSCVDLSCDGTLTREGERIVAVRLERRSLRGAGEEYLKVEIPLDKVDTFIEMLENAKCQQQSLECGWPGG